MFVFVGVIWSFVPTLFVADVVSLALCIFIFSYAVDEYGLDPAVAIALGSSFFVYCIGMRVWKTRHDGSTRPQS